MQSLAFYEGVIMKILVFSDTHGDVTKMERAIRSHSDAEVIIHCGESFSKC
jgi:predicted phosphodiesterase